MRKGYRTNTKVPLNDLVEFYGLHSRKRFQVCMLHKDVSGPDDDNWEHSDHVATFTNYHYALKFAEDFANHRYVWCGGVLLRA